MDSRNLQDKLKLLTLFRLLVAVVFLLAAFFGMRDELHFLSSNGRELVYGAVTGLLLLCAVFAGLLENWWDKRRLTLLAYGHFVGDALFATALVTLTGGVESIFTFFYSLAIINASIALYRRGAIFTAMANTLCLVLVAMGQMNLLGETFRSILSDGTVFWRTEGFAEDLVGILPGLTVNILALFGIAFLSSFLAEQMESADSLAREHEAGLAKLTNLHENIVSSLDSGLVTIDAAGQVTYVNGRACTILGRVPEQLMSCQVRQLFPDLGVVLDNPDKNRRTHAETTLHIIGGRKTYLRWTISPLQDADEQQVGHTLLFGDISKLKEMEVEVERTERLAALGRLAANIAHEIRNPLASMSGSIQLLSETLDVDGSDRRLMDIVVREADHLNHWIGDFLDYARPRDPHFETVELSALAVEVMEMLRNDERATGVTITGEHEGEAKVEGDRGRLRQMLWNLALNAVEAVRHHGEVRIRTHGEPNAVTLQVTDDGPGIDAEQAGRIFEPFFTTKSKGTGLGLAAVHRTVQEHNGSIRVETNSDPGETAFVVILPRWPRKVATLSERAAPPEE